MASGSFPETVTGRKTRRLAPAQLWSLALSCLAVALVTAAMVALYSALPPIAADTGATQAQLTWIVTATPWLSRAWYCRAARSAIATAVAR